LRDEVEVEDEENADFVVWARAGDLRGLEGVWQGLSWLGDWGPEPVAVEAFRDMSERAL
jgi:hypothetical protein